MGAWVHATLPAGLDVSIEMLEGARKKIARMCSVEEVSVTLQQTAFEQILHPERVLQGIRPIAPHASTFLIGDPSYDVSKLSKWARH